MPGNPGVRLEGAMVVKTDNLLDRYEELWVIFGVDPKTGKEGILAYFDIATMTTQPLVTGELDKVDDMVAMVKPTLIEMGSKARLVKFTKRKDIRTIVGAS